MALQTKVVHDVQALLDPITTGSGAITANGAGVRMSRPVNGVVFVLDVTAAATVASNTLDVTIQTRIDDGVGENWLDVVHFSQVLGNGGAKQFVEKITTSATEAGYEVGSALGAGEVRNILGDEWRVKYVQVDASETAQFTFGVSACPM